MGIEVLITGVIGIITSCVSSWTTWFFTRKKYNTEVDNNLIENMKESLDFYMRLSDDNKRRLDIALERNEVLAAKVEELQSRLSDMMYNICVDLTCQLRQRDYKLFGNKHSYKANKKKDEEKSISNKEEKTC